MKKLFKDREKDRQTYQIVYIFLSTNVQKKLCSIKYRRKIILLPKKTLFLNIVPKGVKLLFYY